MTKKFKKIICFILCLCLIIGIVSTSLILFKPFVEERNTLDTGLRVSQMVRENDMKYYEMLNNSDVESVEIPNRLVVKTNDSLSFSDDVKAVYGKSFAFLQCKDKESAELLKQELDKKGIDYCNDYVSKTISADSTDESYPKNWAYERVESEEAIKLLSTTQKSKRINVMVVDTGVNYNHASLIPRVTDHSVNFSSSGNENNSKDDHGHGTAVSGVIVKSTPSNVKIQAVKLMDENGRCNLSQFITCLEYLSSLATPPDIINMSLGFPTGDFNIDIWFQIDKLCRDVIATGAVGVCAAGNDNTAGIGSVYPAGCEEFIVVGATDFDSSKAYFSNYNLDDGESSLIDIAAPGIDINSYQMSSLFESMYSGTSLSSPLVAAACAIALMQDNSLTPSEVENKIKRSAIPFKIAKIVFSTQKWEWIYRNWNGSGILNFYNIIDGDRVSDVKIDYIADNLDYSDLKIGLSCDEENTTIYYTTDGSRPTKSSTVYTEPIEITGFTRICAVAYSNSSSKKLHSYYSATEADIKLLPELDSSQFEVDSRHYITKYKGNKTSLKIESIGRFPVNGIAEGAFENSNVKYIELGIDCYDIEKDAFKNSDIEAIVSEENALHNYNYLYDKKYIDNPEASAYRTKYGINSVGESAFEGCKNLKCFSSYNLVIIGKNAFKDCTSLTDMNIHFGTVVKEGAFMNTGLISISIPCCNSVPNNAFLDSKAETISVPLAKNVGSNAFGSSSLKEVNLSSVEEFVGENNFVNCVNLQNLDIKNSKNLPSFYYDDDVEYSSTKTIYAPKATVFLNNTSNLEPMKSLRYIYAPNLVQIGQNVLLPNTTLYSTSKLSNARNSNLYAVVGYDDTYAQSYAVQNECRFISLDGHKLIFDSLGNEYCNFICKECSKTVAFPRELIEKECSVQLINKYVGNNNYNIMFDIVTDGIINAKDYAKFKIITK